MSSKMPSLTALLGLVAVAGYQNRDKISEFVKGLSGNAAKPATTAAAPAAIPGGIGGALGGLLDQFTKNGQGDVAGSWVGTGKNAAINGGQLSQALGPDIVAMIAKQTGLSPEDLLGRLAQTLPQVVDGLTPNGKIPPEPM
jgi:uncharacterized protein YidB (DUF937 family)